LACIPNSQVTDVYGFDLLEMGQIWDLSSTKIRKLPIATQNPTADNKRQRWTAGPMRTQLIVFPTYREDWKYLKLSPGASN
jgi:hypothetical protein